MATVGTTPQPRLDSYAAMNFHDKGMVLGCVPLRVRLRPAALCQFCGKPKAGLCCGKIASLRITLFNDAVATPYSEDVHALTLQVFQHILSTPLHALSATFSCRSLLYSAFIPFARRVDAECFRSFPGNVTSSVCKHLLRPAASKRGSFIALSFAPWSFPE